MGGKIMTITVYTGALSITEFRALERNADGDILELASLYHRLTETQVAQVTGDDAARMQDFEEEAANDMNYFFDVAGY